MKNTFLSFWAQRRSGILFPPKEPEERLYGPNQLRNRKATSRDHKKMMCFGKYFMVETDREKYVSIVQGATTLQNAVPAQ